MTTQTTESQLSGPPGLTQTCEVCEKKFRSAKGLGQHRRIMHPVQSNDRVNVERTSSRWALEEVRLMAHMEAKATIDGVTHLNKHLRSLKPERTLDAIKGKRREQSYKMQVSSFIESLRKELETAATGNENVVSDDEGRLSQREQLVNEIKQSVAKLSTIRNKYAKALQELGEAALCGKRMDDGVFTHVIRSMFGTTVSPKGPRHSRVVQYHGTPKQRRRQRYAHVQKLYARDVKAAVRVVLNDEDQVSIKLPECSDVFRHWGEVFSSGEGMPSDVEWDEGCEKDSMAPLWNAVTIEEVMKARVACDSAPGLDGISPSAWNKVNNEFKRLIYNLFIFYERVPNSFKMSRTVFTPKVEGGADDPAEFRPLTICSVVLRGFNKILAERLVSLHDFDDRQNAYLPRDGVGACVFTLSGLIANAKDKLQEMHVAGLDITKAFPSLKHADIIRTQIRAGCPRGFVSYMRNMYEDASTLMQFEGHERVTRIRQGVFQGDPLSGPNFTMSLEGMLKSLDNNVGVVVRGVETNAGAYADDTNLYASTRKGLQENMDKYSNSGEIKGQLINAKKSWTLSLVPSGKEKKMKVQTGKPFNIGGVKVKELTIADVWRYLGVNYTSNGPEKVNVNIEADLQRLSKAPLKPQQRVHILKAYVIPKYQDKLVLGKVVARSLKEIDKRIREYVRKWLSLPNDVPVAYLHAPVKAGGLGIPCLQLWVPLMRLNRLERAIESGGSMLMALSEENLFKSIIHRCKQSLAVMGTDRLNLMTYHSYWREQLIQMVDGKDLRDAWVHKSTTNLNSTMMHRVSGEDYVHYQQIRSNALPTRARTARGRPAKDVSCRGGCRKTETAHHVVQECHRTHGVRVQRHDRIVNILGEELGRKYEVLPGQEFLTARGKRKPDLILLKDDTAYVVDVQVVGNVDLNASHERKVGKYDFDEMTGKVKERYDVGNVIVHTCTLSFKGVWSAQSVANLKELRVPEYCFFMIVTSALRGTWLAWRCFNSVTHVVRRQGLCGAGDRG